MTTLEASTATESPGEVLHRLEVTVIWMWSTEPVCPTGDRHALLARLGAVSAQLDRLAFRHRFEPDHVVDVADLITCVVELDDLCDRWLDVGEAEEAPT